MTVLFGTATSSSSETFQRGPDVRTRLRPPICAPGDSASVGRDLHRRAERILGNTAGPEPKLEAGGRGNQAEVLDSRPRPRPEVRSQSHTVFKSEGARVIVTPLMAPMANAHAERWVGSWKLRKSKPAWPREIDDLALFRVHLQVQVLHQDPQSPQALPASLRQRTTMSCAYRTSTPMCLYRCSHTRSSGVLRESAKLECAAGSRHLVISYLTKS